jgi:polysaccharide biosynthesis protein PslH
MAMGRPVVATPQALDGIRDCPEMRWAVAEAPADLAKLCVEVLENGDSAGRGRKGRACVLAHYSWAEHMDRLVALLDAPVAPEAVPARAGVGG